MNMVHFLATETSTLVSPGLDLEKSFLELLSGLGVSPQLAHVLWLPLPMLLVVAAAFLGVLVTVWLERKIYSNNI